MKIQIDTQNKTIKVEEDVNLDEFICVLNKLFPQKEWKEYKLITGTVIVWNNPIAVPYINPFPVFGIPNTPLCPPYIVTCNSPVCVEINPVDICVTAEIN